MHLEETLGSFLRAKRIARKSPQTLDWYERHIRVWLRWLAESDIAGMDWLEPEVLEAFLADEQERGLAPNTIDAYWRSLRAFFRWMKKRRLLVNQDLPTDIVERPGVPVTQPDQADYQAVLRVLASIRPQNWLDLRDQVLIQLLLSTGLRIEEAMQLTIHDIDLKEGFVRVQAGKGHKERFVPFDVDFGRAFVAYIYNRPSWLTDALFLAGNGHRKPCGVITSSGVRQMLERRCAAAGVEPIHPHSMRHLFATKALNDGVPLSAVSAMLGHCSVSFTARVYAKWIKRGLREKYDAHWRTK